MDYGYFVFPSDQSSILEFMEQVQSVYSHVEDEVSKKMYLNRLLYSLTLDLKYIRNTIMLTQAGLEFDQMLDKIGQQPILIYGAGKRGRELVELFPEKNWGGFIDQGKRGHFGGLEIKSFGEYTCCENMAVIISNQVGYEDIAEDLTRWGVPPKNIIILEEWNQRAAQEQYFEGRCVRSDAVRGGFVDSGAFDGANSVSFAEWIKDDSRKIWAFEPDTIQYEHCKKNLEPFGSIQIYDLAVSDRTENLDMVMCHFGSSHIQHGGAEGGTQIPAVALDELLGNEQIGYIKTDLEGWEEKALIGMEKIIRKQHPVLGISVYHKRTDIIDIPNLILRYYPNYKFKLGHYGVLQIDTVLYALPQ